MCLCVSAPGGQRHQIYLELKVQGVVRYMVLGTKLWSSTRAVGARVLSSQLIIQKLIQWIIFMKCLASANNCVDH